MVTVKRTCKGTGRAQVTEKRRRERQGEREREREREDTSLLSQVVLSQAWADQELFQNNPSTSQDFPGFIWVHPPLWLDSQASMVKHLLLCHFWILLHMCSPPPVPPWESGTKEGKEGVLSLVARCCDVLECVKLQLPEEANRLMLRSWLCSTMSDSLCFLHLSIISYTFGTKGSSSPHLFSFAHFYLPNSLSWWERRNIVPTSGAVTQD